MEVILIQNVEKIGKTGNLIKVKDGFARNFLLPQKLAVLATAVNLAKIEQEKKKVAILQQQVKAKSTELASRLEGVSITLPVAVIDEEKIYGSISALDIIEALEQEGIPGVAKEAIILDEPIKLLGVYDITVKFAPDVSAVIKVWIVKK